MKTDEDSPRSVSHHAMQVTTSTLVKDNPDIALTFNSICGRLGMAIVLSPTVLLFCNLPLHNKSTEVEQRMNKFMHNSLDGMI